MDRLTIVIRMKDSFVQVPGESVSIMIRSGMTLDFIT